MRRREFITLLGGAAAVAWPSPLLAQQTKKMRRIGRSDSFREKRSPRPGRRNPHYESIARDLGWIDGQNIQIIVRVSSALNDDIPIAEKAKELLGLSPDVILASPTSALLPLLKETTNIPIVFAVVSDPLSQGIVASLARPGGHITGFSNPPSRLLANRYKCLKILRPACHGSHS